MKIVNWSALVGKRVLITDSSTATARYERILLEVSTGGLYLCFESPEGGSYWTDRDEVKLLTILEPKPYNPGKIHDALSHCTPAPKVPWYKTPVPMDQWPEMPATLHPAYWPRLWSSVAPHYPSGLAGSSKFCEAFVRAVANNS